MTDLQCPATIVLAAPGIELPGGLAAVYTPEAAHLRQAVDELSDLHRGETIAVLAPAEAIAAALGSDEPVELPVTVAVDSSGWTIVDQRGTNAVPTAQPPSSSRRR